MKISPISFGWMDIRPIQELIAQAERENALPASMWKPMSEPRKTAAEAKEIRAHVFAVQNLYYYRRDLLNVLNARVGKLSGG